MARADLRRIGRILVNPALGLRLPQFDRIDRAQRRFLGECAPALFERAADRRIVDGHGDLRPEHIFLGEPLAVIDRLEFDARLRAVDPLDEIESLAVECAQLGQRAVGEYLVERVSRRLHDPIPPGLAAFYRCYRATLRARLAIAHLLDAEVRDPEKWPDVAARYLALATREARALDALHDVIRRRRGSAWPARSRAGIRCASER